MPSIRHSETPKLRRRKTPIEPIHVEELLAGAGMSGFLGVLDTPVAPAHLEKQPAPSEISAKVASVVLKLEALTDLMDATSKNGGSETKNSL